MNHISSGNDTSDKDSETDQTLKQATKKKRTRSGRAIGMAQGGSDTSSTQGNMAQHMNEYVGEIGNISSRINIIDRQMVDNDQKYGALTSAVIKLSKSYETLYGAYTDLQKRSMGNNILISNIDEYHNENLVDACKDRLARMGVDYERVDIERAHRTGPSLNRKPRQVVARLLRQDHVQHVLQTTKPNRNVPYDPFAVRVTPQIPNSIKHAKTRAYDIAEIARERNPESEVFVQGDKVYIDNKSVQDPVEPPTIEEKLLMSKADKIKACNTKFYISEVISENKSHFQLYSSEIHDTADANNAYRAISLNPMASLCTHMISAYWIDNDQQGYFDDHDHGLGKHLLGVMQEADMINSICFLTREYGGQHLGFRRFEIISELVDDIFDKAQGQQQLPTYLNIYKRKRVGKTTNTTIETTETIEPTETLQQQRPTNQTPQQQRPSMQPPQQQETYEGDKPHQDYQVTPDQASLDNPNTSTPRSGHTHEQFGSQPNSGAEDAQSDLEEQPWNEVRGRGYMRRTMRRGRGNRGRGFDHYNQNEFGPSRPRGGRRYSSRGHDYNRNRSNSRGHDFNTRRGQTYVRARTNRGSRQPPRNSINTEPWQSGSSWCNDWSSRGRDQNHQNDRDSSLSNDWRSRGRGQNNQNDRDISLSNEWSSRGRGQNNQNDRDTSLSNEWSPRDRGQNNHNDRDSSRANMPSLQPPPPPRPFI
jgi:hypothetical protein